MREPKDPRNDIFETLFLALLITLAILTIFNIVPGCVRAETINAPVAVNIEKLATAIYYAEGGTATAHPYGILAHYKTTTPRQACINTIKHALRDWNGQGDFIAFLGSRYCPVGAKNDPTGLNKNWVKNVKKLYAKARG
jgi:hypothetical protein